MLSRRLTHLFLVLALGSAGIATAAEKNVPKSPTCAGTGPDLLEAVDERNPAKVLVCLQNGADADFQDGEAIAYAAARNEPAIIKVLLENGAHLESALDRALAVAALRGHEEVVDLFLNNPRYKTDLNKPGNRTLAYAARSGNINILRKLAEVGAKDDDGFAVASAIVARQHASFDYLLQEVKISPNAGNGILLSVAISSGDKYFVTTLLEKGADTTSFPVIAETIADIRKARAENKKTEEDFRHPAYDEIIALVETAMSKAAAAEIKPKQTALAPS